MGSWCPQKLISPFHGAVKGLHTLTSLESLKGRCKHLISGIDGFKRVFSLLSKGCFKLLKAEQQPWELNLMLISCSLERGAMFKTCRIVNLEFYEAQNCAVFSVSEPALKRRSEIVTNLRENKAKHYKYTHPPKERNQKAEVGVPGCILGMGPLCLFLAAARAGRWDNPGF